MDLQVTRASEKEKNTPCSIQCWIVANTEERAAQIARQHLTSEGWEIVKIKELFLTTPDDYFPPCNGLDSYRKAEKTGACYLLPETNLNQPLSLSR